MIKKFFLLSLAFISLLSFTSCEKEVNEGYSDELLRLQAYMSIHYPNIEPTASGLYYIVLNEGNGAKPQAGNYLRFDYTGQNLNEIVYETTVKSIAELNDIYSKTTYYAPKYLKYKDEQTVLLKGLDEGFTYIKEGSEVRLIIPSPLAYGAKSYKSLNPYSTIILDIDFHEIVTDPDQYELDQISNYIAQNYPSLDVEQVISTINEDGVYILEESLTEVEVDEEDEEEPTDPHVEIEDNDVISVDYTGRFLDHWIFDTSIKEVAEENGTYQSTKTYEPLKVTIGGTGYIEGFSLSLKKLKTNSKAKVIILSKHAYGEYGSDNIQPYTPLIFELDVHAKTTAASSK